MLPGRTLSWVDETSPQDLCFVFAIPSDLALGYILKTGLGLILKLSKNEGESFSLHLSLFLPSE